MKTRKAFGWMVGFAVAVATSACAPTDNRSGGTSAPMSSFDESIMPAGFDARTPRSERVFIAGTIGDVAAASGAGATTTLRKGGNGGDSELEPGAVRIDVSNPSAPVWMMMRFTATRSLTSVPLGTVMDSDDDANGDSTVDVVGCAGPHPDEYTVDARPDRVRVKVEAGADADTRLIRFVATFDNQTVQGAYEIEAE